MSITTIATTNHHQLVQRKDAKKDPIRLIVTTLIVTKLCALASWRLCGQSTILNSNTALVKRLLETNQWLPASSALSSQSNLELHLNEGFF